ncbi:MAG: hypothetical protein EP326_08550 [Deltaproteobacteria bacterium]|nr:MAG: hypothetical protein EP326_08550 [Deltaproteobacteria bacterium]TNF30701.1 MAG: hypothetical protein EP319_04275 [Deltaproteobacteria bacterium]
MLQTFKFICSILLFSLTLTIEASLPFPDVKKSKVIIRDEIGRHVIYRGINTRVKNIFDVNFNDGRLPLELIPEFTENDAMEIAKIGFNLVRLPVNWSGIQPNPTEFNEAYISKILSFMDICEKFELDVLIDMHQDAYSKEIGEDGAPDWAILPKNFTPNPGGELGNLTLKRISLDTQYAFTSFWKNLKVNGTGLQDHYINSIIFLLKKVSKHKSFVGIELFNEPWLINIEKFTSKDDPYTHGIQIDMLWNFYKKAISRIRKSYPEIWIYLEPDVTKSVVIPFLNSSKDQFKAIGLPKSPPWNTYKTVYAPHLYTLGMVIGDFLGKDWLDPKDPGIWKSIDYSIVESNQIDAGLLIGEFGFSHKSKNYEKTLHNILDTADIHLIHTAQWLWKEASQDSWGFWDYSKTDGFTLRHEIALKSARPYPSKISGTISGFRLDRHHKILEIFLSTVNKKHFHEVIWPHNYGYKANPIIVCGDRLVKWSRKESKLIFKCDKNVIQIF